MVQYEAASVPVNQANHKPWFKFFSSEPLIHLNAKTCVYVHERIRTVWIWCLLLVNITWQYLAVLASC